MIGAFSFASFATSREAKTTGRQPVLATRRQSHGERRAGGENVPLLDRDKGGSREGAKHAKEASRRCEALYGIKTGPRL
jgi:hypothetical protein